MIDLSTLKENSRGNYLSTHVVSQTDSNSQGIFWKDLSHSSIVYYQVLFFSQSDCCADLQRFSVDLLSVEDSSPKANTVSNNFATSNYIHQNVLITTEDFTNGFELLNSATKNRISEFISATALNLHTKLLTTG